MVLELNPMSDPPLSPELVAALADRYRIERELGQGGMATVYLARDLKHDRPVAIKIFRPEIAASLGTERFLREIGFAARLSHPHILGLHDSGEAGGLLYYVMPYLEGKSLRQRLDREGPLPIDEVARLVREVSAALAHAHQQGIVHRDIKPENILLQGDAAIVADFGIARAMEEVGGDRLTGTGISIGTPTYMSPEQGMGGAVDGRSDVYSLACVAYELLTGEPPFSGKNWKALLARHSVDPVPSLRALRPTVNEELEAVIARALAKTPADRQPGVAVFAADFSAAAAIPSGTGMALPQRRRIPAWVLGAAAVVLVAVAVAVAQWLRSGEVVSELQAADLRPRLAVLPFTSIGPADDQYIAEGLSDEITSRVSGLSGIAVLARSSTIPLARAGRPASEIARELNAGYVLTGSVQTERGAGRVRIRPSLIKVEDGTEMLSGTSYDLELAPGKLLQMQSQIAEKVAQTLNVSLLASDRRALAVPPTDNLEAYQAFLRGNLFAQQKYSEEPTRQAIAMYQEAVTADPRFGPAWAKLAQAQIAYFYQFDRAPSRLEQARAALARATQLDSIQAETRLARAQFYYFGDQDYDRAEQEFAALRSERPNDSEVLSWLATIQRRRGKFDDALAMFRRAGELDPRSQQYALELGVTHLMLRQFADAEKDFDRASTLAPDWLAPIMIRSFLYWTWKGDKEAALAELRGALRYHSMRDLLTYLIPLNPHFILTVGGEFEDSLLGISPRDLTVDAGFVYLAKGLAYHRLGDPRAVAYFDSARVVWEPRVRARPQEWRFRTQLGIAYAGLGRRQEALAEGRAAVALLPLSRDAQAGSYPLTSMVTIAVLLGEVDTAVAYLRPLIEHPSQISRNLLQIDPLFASLKDNAGFRRLVR
jgi:TolB-like protein/Flp pilus assembly protein TadD